MNDGAPTNPFPNNTRVFTVPAKYLKVGVGWRGRVQHGEYMPDMGWLYEVDFEEELGYSGWFACWEWEIQKRKEQEAG